MKKIEVFTEFHHFNDFCHKLRKTEGVTGVTVINARGFGRGKPEYGEQILKDKTKIEIYCADEVADSIISTILDMTNARQKFKGKIYVMPVEDAVRISTGERGAGEV